MHRQFYIVNMSLYGNAQAFSPIKVGNTVFGTTYNSVMYVTYLGNYLGI